MRIALCLRQIQWALLLEPKMMAMFIKARKMSANIDGE